ncbi:MAG TPA: DUF2470 domain-containing protein [Rugosimonospora sp.]
MLGPALPAEIARTLVAGHLPGLVHVPRWAAPVPVRYVADAAGQPLMLVGYASTAAEALWRAGNGSDVPVAVAVPDVPPGPTAPSLGRAWVSGWARPLTGTGARDAALEFATVRPTGDLLGLGRGFVLYRVGVVAVRLEPPANLQPCGATVEDGAALGDYEPAGRHGPADNHGAGNRDTVDVDPAEYAAAEPDPLHPIEGALLAHLADHHRGELAALLHRLAPGAGTCGAIVTPVRLDRYGVLVELTDPTARNCVPPRRIRVDFPAPLHDPYGLVALLRPAHPPARGPARSEHR